MAPRPSVKAILVCDQIIHEYGTNKKSLIGIFEDIHLPHFPILYPRIAVYVNLTDAHGKYRMDLRLIRAETGDLLGQALTPEVEIDNPLKTCEFALNLQGVQFPEKGLYEFQVHVNGQLLATKSFNVRQVRRTPKPPPDPGRAGDAPA